MYKVNINKNKQNSNNGFEFNLFIKKASIQTNIWEQMKDYNFKDIPSLYEDLFVLSLAALACDKRFSRKKEDDAWTRSFKLIVPALNYKTLNNNKQLFDQMLSFLTGDIWDIEFKYEKYRMFSRKTEKKDGNDFEYEAISLFSGGLDSFCGAINNFENGKNVLYVGNKENRNIDQTQKNIFDSIVKNYPNVKSNFHSFTVDIHKVSSNGESVDEQERTTRSRSFMFICSALLFAGISKDKDLKIYVPENAFIGLNLPLTPSRIGSCSTRTTHPYYFKMFNELLEKLGLKNEIINPFKYKSKREIVEMVKDTKAFKTTFFETISCSHPTVQRYKGKSSKNINCGVCYPCLIRQSSLFHLGDFEEKEKNTINKIVTSDIGGSSKDLIALIDALYIYEQSKDRIKNRVRGTGFLTDEEICEYTKVYKNTMNDIKDLFLSNKKIRDYGHFDESN